MGKFLNILEFYLISSSTSLAIASSIDLHSDSEIKLIEVMGCVVAIEFASVKAMRPADWMEFLLEE